MSWLARLRRDQRRGHWTHWLDLFEIGALVHMIRGFWLIREPKSDENDDE